MVRSLMISLPWIVTGERNPTGSKILLMIDTPLLVKGFPSEETVKTNVSLTRPTLA